VDTWFLLSLIIILQDKLLLYPYVWGICLIVSLSRPFGKVLCYGMVLSFWIKKLELFGFNATEPYMLHTGLTFPAVMTSAIPGTPIREPHGSNVYLLLQWLLMLQATSLGIGLIMALLKLILWGIGPPLWWDQMKERFSQIYGSSELLLLISI
jgi:hypothetical protein